MFSLKKKRGQYNKTNKQKSEQKNQQKIASNQEKNKTKTVCIAQNFAEKKIEHDQILCMLTVTDFILNSVE